MGREGVSYLLVVSNTTTCLRCGYRGGKGQTAAYGVTPKPRSYTHIGYYCHFNKDQSGALDLDPNIQYVIICTDPDPEPSINK